MTATWIALDDALVAHYKEKMGKQSPYNTLKVKKVVAVVLRDRKQWETWATEGDIPALVIEGSDAGYGPGPHGRGAVTLASEYPYHLVAILRADSDVEATRQIKELVDRLVLATSQVRIAINPDEVQPLSAIPSVREAHLTIYRAPGGENQWFGLGIVDITVGRRQR